MERKTKTFTDIYMEMLSPLDLKLIHKRHWNMITYPILGSITWPINVSYQILKTGYKQATNTYKHGDQYGVFAAISAPLFLPHSLKELVAPSVKGLGVSNMEKLLKERIITTRPDDQNPAIIFGHGTEGPNFFGDSSSLSGKKGYIDLFFPDGLSLGDHGALYPANSEKTYESSNHFIKVNPDIKTELRDLVKKEGVWDPEKREDRFSPQF
ncbi:hypothetical protein HNV12_03055 [Methanococcoides sp. SA1]|nr:hypothetical protein [Methanococcoides sp. SA1]